MKSETNMQGSEKTDMPATQSPSTAATGTQRAPYKLGVALSGGGARGFAHAGALMAIEEAGLRPDIIAGVSAGAVIAVLYAAGISPLSMAQLFSKSGFLDFAELNFGNAGLFRIDRFKHFVLRALGGRRLLEELDIPVYLGATDLDNGRPTAFHTGEIGDRMIASCSIPIVFRPGKIDGINDVDGGVRRNHPAWIIRDTCEKRLGINVSPLGKTGECSSIIDVALRTYNLMAKANQNTDMALCDISVSTPELASYKVFNMKHIGKVFMSGYIHTRRALRDAGLWNPTPDGPSLSEALEKLRK